ncbi:LuxR C-terminal-related transcriptional regulator [Kitasatospora viridis]|uniref:Regulatory LuxR family protein n=1 Tax=Kitasatospora viridis TaxID=281105 RepID=A0A561UPY4_9ACTN|nr:LuxR C-terminal-related transcriptional regulator [Kitasatospora viridis]TWG01437.1 regulatory LuxR family protein [Kitasatospora viridis]
MHSAGEMDHEMLAVYRAVLLARQADHAEVAERTGLAPAQVREVAGRLVALSLLAPSWELPGTFRAVSPERGMEILRQREQRESAERRYRIERSQAALSLLVAECEVRARTGALEELTGIDEIRTRLEALASSCRQESLAFQPLNTLSETAIKAGQPLNDRALDRGVRFRTIFLDGLGRDRTTRDYTQWLVRRGGEIRTAPTLPMRMLIVDGTTAVLSGAADGSPTALVLHSPPVVHALRALFEAYWEQATPLGGSAAAPESGLRPQERELLKLLATGMTDEAVARALGIGLRTERRIVAELMERLGASSRFEAGYQAARLEWI